MNNLNDIFFAPAANQDLTYDQVLEDVQRYFAENHASTIAEAGEGNAERATTLLKELMVQYIVKRKYAIEGLTTEELCEKLYEDSEIVLPGGQRLLAAAIKILFLPLQIIFDLHQAHSVCDKHQILGADLFLFAPAQHVVRDTLSGPLLKLQPGQSFCVSIHLPQAAEF